METIAQADMGAANSVSAGSLIIALHARYEAAWAEYNEIDTAQPPKPKDVKHPDWTLHWRLNEAMSENREETDALQQAILHQIPDTDEELAVLAYHAGSVFDCASTLTEAEKTALERGLVSILDYLVSEGRADPVKLGGMFANSARIASARVRRRTGNVEG